MAEPDHKSDIPRALKEWRERAGLTQEQAAAALGLHELTISRWERGDREPGSANYQKAIAHYMRIAEEKAAYLSVPRGTSDSPWQAFVARVEREAVRRGATDEEADYLRASLQTKQAMHLMAEVSGTEPYATELVDSLVAWIDRRVSARRALEIEPIQPKDVPAAVAKRRAELDAEKPKRRAR